METKFVTTPWRDSHELLQVRRGLFGQEVEEKKRAVNKIFTWRDRKLELPLLLESTADIVHALIQHEHDQLPSNTLRLVYATAVSRFMTGLADTQTELTRCRPAFFPPPSQKPLTFPLFLRETRHCIVHRHMPGLVELERAAKQSLQWLWEWYWSHLEAAMSTNTTLQPPSCELLSEREVRERLHIILKTYVRARKMEIRNRSKVKEGESKAAQAAVSSFFFVRAPYLATAATSLKHKILLELLVTEKAILPADKKLGSSMSGALLIWSPFLLALCKMSPSWLRLLLDSLVGYLSATTRQVAEKTKDDAAREGMHDWATHILLSKDWDEAHCQETFDTLPETSTEVNVAGAALPIRTLVTHVLDQVFMAPSYWSMKLAESLLQRNNDILGRASWWKILEAAKEGDSQMSGDENAQHGEGVPVRTEEKDSSAMEVDVPRPSSLEKLRGPQKKAGIWKWESIGTIPGGWEDDA